MVSYMPLFKYGFKKFTILVINIRAFACCNNTGQADQIVRQAEAYKKLTEKIIKLRRELNLRNRKA